MGWRKIRSVEFWGLLPIESSLSLLLMVEGGNLLGPLSNLTAPLCFLSVRTALSSSFPTAKGRRSKPAKQMGMGRWLKASISPTRSQQPLQQSVMSGLRQYGEESLRLELPFFSPRIKWPQRLFGYLLSELEKGGGKKCLQYNNYGVP